MPIKKWSSCDEAKGKSHASRVPRGFPRTDCRFGRAGRSRCTQASVSGRMRGPECSAGSSPAPGTARPANSQATSFSTRTRESARSFMMTPVDMGRIGREPIRIHESAIHQDGPECPPIGHQAWLLAASLDLRPPACLQLWRRRLRHHSPRCSAVLVSTQSRAPPDCAAETS